MNYFFDTSAFVKYFHTEEGSSIVIGLIENNETSSWILDLSRVEFISAISRKFRTKELNEKQINEVKNSFDEGCKKFNIINISKSIISEAENLLIKFGKEHSLKAYDSIQLSTFSIIASKDWKFVASDDVLCNVAKLLGYEVINPMIEKYSCE